MATFPEYGYLVQMAIFYINSKICLCVVNKANRYIGGATNNDNNHITTDIIDFSGN